MTPLRASSTFWSKVAALALFLNVPFLYFMVLSSNDEVQVRPNNMEECPNIRIADPKRHRVVNKLITEYDDKINGRMRDLVTEKVKADDGRLIALIKEMMDPPSDHILKPARVVIHTPQSEEASKVLEQKRNGFFIECGAFDGERSSNTLYLETKMGWSGLLVEMDPYFYTQLLGKSRRAWSINACLSPTDSPTFMDFVESSGGMGQLIDKGSSPGKGVIRKVPCFPFHSLLLAINQTKVDFFSLDVEGFELEVLKTVPFDKVDISVLTVEYLHGRTGKYGYQKFMTEKGYTVYKDIHFVDPKMSLAVDDLIFVKQSLMPKVKTSST